LQTGPAVALAMITGCVVTFQPVYLLSRQHRDAARATGGETPTRLAMALQQQGAIGGRQPPAKITRFVNSEAFHLVGGLDDCPVGERRHETKAPRVPRPKLVRHGDTVALRPSEDAGLEFVMPMVEKKPARLA